ncbi:MAG: hypothetical protein LC642_08660, partial [Verrucomicrobiaceae bacterium]|nr:hypothetical protein [Verrucomicrobiaceae bacterium]
LDARPAFAGEEVPATIAQRRITAREVFRNHLLYGIESIEPAQLRFAVQQSDACRRFRSDVPEETRVALLAKAKADLARSLDRVGRDWTLADWMESQTNQKITAHLRETVQSALHDGASHNGQDEKPAARLSGPSADHWLGKLQIPSDRQGYLESIDRHCSGIAGANAGGPEHVRRLWLRAETEVLKKLARLHFGCDGTYEAIASHVRDQPEAFALGSLWNACLAAYDLQDPFAPTHAVHLQEQNPDAISELLQEQLRHLERWGGPPIMLDADLRVELQAFIDRELEHLQQNVAPEKSSAAGEELPLLLQFGLHDLETNELNRRAIDALETLLADRAAQKDQELLEKLRRRDPRRQMRQRAQETLAAE